jgi:thiol-disulfide isomerase/thioredoxin
MKSVCAIPLLAAFAAVAPGQTGPDILKKVSETYRELKTYHFEAQVVSESVSESNESRSRSTRISAAKAPNLRRIETKGGQTAAARIFDGETVWEYRPGPNQFARQPQAEYKPPRMNFLGDPADNYRNLEKMAAEAKVLREETIAAAGGDRACWVLEVKSPFPAGGMIVERSPTVYWIDKTTNLVLKQVEAMKMKPPSSDFVQSQTTTTTYAVARTGGAADELFRFAPPAGAAEVSEFTSPFGGGSMLTGKTAPSLAMPDLEGKEVTLESLRGKPVLVNFWATWCAPCREQMPKIQDVARAYADKGLVVLAVNMGEAPDVAKKYIEEKQYTFRVLLDRDKSLSNRFTVSSIPVLFLIDREGNIRAHHVGYSTGLDLREELKKIGL